ncbi:MAG: D-alanyl-D-alanine carboxypeptidase [Holosporaceae bacterium]|jgi:D-alanyl-D-alanine carboxypeptidase|nr:D-alanyl-D-alanine carboxypeptidase [Holosporaceae bacterium]
MGLVFSGFRVAPALLLSNLRLLLMLLLVFSHREYSVCSGCLPTTAALVVDVASGKILYSRNAFLKIQPASLTKMMTLLLVFKALQLKQISLRTPMIVSSNAASQKPCALGLHAGDIITVQDAIMATITKSANDAAVVLAEHLGHGSEKYFVQLMNAEAKRLRMYSTIFMNASGWKNPEQLSTVFDMAKLACVLMLKYPEYYKFFAAKHFVYNKNCFKNHNKLLGTRNGIVIDGIKTGFVCASGFNIAVSARMKRKRLIAIVFGGETADSRDRCVQNLLSRAFAHHMRMISVKYHENDNLIKAKNNQRVDEKNKDTERMGIYNRIFGVYQKACDSSHSRKKKICDLLKQG